ncbi:MAG: helix-turn-helix domain-containing protein [Chloroflexi bacterium]|nr:helix-turn-helix domain-containing protein [Chloroflexota bacterium]
MAESEFASLLQHLRRRANKSRYELHKVTGLDQAYLKRLEDGSKTNPSREAVLMLGFALVRGNEAIHIEDIDELLLAAGYAPLRRWDRAKVG